MDTKEKPFKNKLEASGILVSKYSGTIVSKPFEPLRVSEDAFLFYAKKHGIVLHRDLHDLESTPPQEKLGEPKKTEITDKEEYITFQACGRPIIIDVMGE